jgi:DUF3014 family protein
MADLDDLSFDSGPAPPPAPPPAKGPPLAPAAIVVAALAAGLGAVWYFGYHDRAPRPQNEVAQTTVDLRKQAPRPPAEPGEKIDLPPLDQSDALVRSLVSRLSSHPVVAAWLTTEGLIRNLTVVVANIADGETPAKHLRRLKPSAPFTVRQSAGLTWIDPASYARYDGIAAAVDGLDARGVARFYATIKPRIDEAYRDLGGGDVNFDRTVERAIVMLLRTPDLDEQVQLRTGKMSYEYASPALETLSKAQRQFLRMGPRNVRIVKAKLREVARYLGIADTALPGTGVASPP